MARALSISELYNTKHSLAEFQDEWLGAFGKPELKGAWLIWGESGSGKTTFVAMLCKYLTRFGRVAYNSLEEGNSETLKLAFKRVKMEEVKNHIVVLDQESIEELKLRLRKPKAPKIVVIDSIQYADLTYKEYKQLKCDFPDKLFILISHAEGRQPEGRIAKKIRFDVPVKITVAGYRAFFVSRFGGGNPITVWEEGAKNYHGF